MIADAIVQASVTFAAAFLAAWALRPGMRAWIERPKYDFQEAVRAYDRARHGDAGTGKSPKNPAT